MSVASTRAITFSSRAHDPAAYRALRKRVEDNRATSHLFNRERYVRHLERGIEAIWENRVRGVKEDVTIPA